MSTSLLKNRRRAAPTDMDMEPEIQAILSHLSSTKKKGVPGAASAPGGDFTSSAPGPSFPRFDFLSNNTPLTPARRIRGAVRATPSKTSAAAASTSKTRSKDIESAAKAKTQTIDSASPVKGTTSRSSTGLMRTPRTRLKALKIIDLTDETPKSKSKAKPKPKLEVSDAKTRRTGAKKISFAIDEDEGAELKEVEIISEALHVVHQDPVAHKMESEHDKAIENLTNASLALADDKNSSRCPPVAAVHTVAEELSRPAGSFVPDNAFDHGEPLMPVETVSAEQHHEGQAVGDDEAYDREESVVEEEIHMEGVVVEEKVQEEVFTEGWDQEEGAHEERVVIEVLDEDDVDGLLEPSSSPPSVSWPVETLADAVFRPETDIDPPEQSPVRLSSHRRSASPKSPTSILLASDLEPECESDVESASEPSFVIAPTPRKGRAPVRRRVVLSESESGSEVENDIVTCHSDDDGASDQFSSELSAPESDPPELFGDSAAVVINTKNRRQIELKKGVPAVLSYIADEAQTRDHDYDSDGEGAEDYNDDSLGSLRDFIVDDDEELSEYADESDDDIVSGSESDGIEILDSPPRSRKVTIPRRDKKEEVKRAGTQLTEKDRGVLYYSPPARKRSLDLELPDLNALTIISSSDEEAEEEEGEEEEKEPSPPTRTRRRPEPESKTARPKDHGHRLRKTEGSSKADFSVKGWAEERTRIADSIFSDLDKRVFEGRIGVNGGVGAGARIEWNKRLLTTAGVARSKRTTKNGQSKREFWIELSEKVLTGKEQIINTVAHEMCHLATWIISNDYKNAHGSVFKSWGRKVMRARSDVEVTTKHSYVIEYKYEWKCGNERCGKIYKRHSKSIDISKHACGSCKGKLKPMFDTKQKTASAFQLYLKENMKFAKAAMPKASHGEVMRALSKRWTDAAAGASSQEGDAEAAALDHMVYWRSMALASAK
ncbi:hypothetical protein I317_07839 [Kwoniella heveanensis CBS 569]|nr:hypothetical protein I317_07839 [Kwoniella heveanensis CBS 569]